MRNESGYCPIGMWNEPSNWWHFTEDEAARAESIGLSVERRKPKIHAFRDLFDAGDWFVRPDTRKNVDRLYEALHPEDWDTVMRYTELGAKRDARSFVDFTLHYDNNVYNPYEYGFFGKIYAYSSFTGTYFEFNKTFFECSLSVSDASGSKKKVREGCSLYAVGREVDIIVQSEGLPLEVSIREHYDSDSPYRPTVVIKNLNPPSPDFL